LVPIVAAIQTPPAELGAWEFSAFVGLSKTPQEPSLPAGLSGRIAMMRIASSSTAFGLELGYLSLGQSTNTAVFPPFGPLPDTTIVHSSSDERGIYLQGLFQWRPTLLGVRTVLTAGGGVQFRKSLFSTTQSTTSGMVIRTREQNFQGAGPSATVGVGAQLVQISRSAGLRIEGRLYGAIISSGSALTFASLTIGIWYRQ